MDLEAHTPSFDRAVSPDALEIIYHQKISTSLARGRDGLDGYAAADSIFEMSERLSESLRNESHCFTQYRENLISKGAGKPPRSISIPTVRDRIALRAIAEYLVELYPHAKGVIPQRCVARVQAALKSRDHNSFVRLDVRNFFPTIQHDLIDSVVRTGSVDPRVPNLVQRAIKTPTVADGSPRLDPASYPAEGVPQGLAISNILAELAVSSVDSSMHAIPNITYVRFVDDILILCDEADVSNMQDTCRRLLTALGLEAHSEDSRGKSAVGRIEKGFDYLGYIFSEEFVSVRPSSVRTMESRLARSFTEYRRRTKARPEAERETHLRRCEWFVNLAITGCIYRGVARGWLQYFRQMDDQTLLKKLDLTVTRLQRRFGLPDSFHPKKFMTAYWPIKHPRPDDTYIPNFDNYTLAQKRDHLRIHTTMPVSEMSELRVTIEFHRSVDRAVSDLERDVGFVS